MGLGPVERSHLSHTIAEVRQTVDAVGPKLRGTLAFLQEAASGLNETVEAAKPKLLATAEHVEVVAGKLEAAKIEDTIATLQNAIAQADALLKDTRPKLGATLASVAEASAGPSTRSSRPRSRRWTSSWTA